MRESFFSTCVHLLTHTCLLGFVLTLQEEQEYVELVAAEKHQQEAVKSALAQNKTLSMLDEILEDVRKAADRLEEEIEEHAFDNNKQVQWLITQSSNCKYTIKLCLTFILAGCVDEGSKCGGGVESGGGRGERREEEEQVPAERSGG